MSDAEPAAPPSQVARQPAQHHAMMRRQMPAERCGSRAAASRAHFFLRSAPLGASDEHVAKTACVKRLMVKSESGRRGGARDALLPNF